MMKTKAKYFLSIMFFIWVYALPSQATSINFDASQFELHAALNSDTLILFQDANLTTQSLEQLPVSTQEQLALAVTDNGFMGQQGEMLEILVPSEVDAKRLILVGVGNTATLSANDINVLGGNIAAKLETIKQKKVRVLAQGVTSQPSFAAELAHGISLRSYRYTHYKTPTDTEIAKDYYFSVDDLSSTQARYKQLKAIEQGVFLARDLTNSPASDMAPEHFAAQAKKLSALGVTISVLGTEEIDQLGMRALAAVGKGSRHSAKLVIAHWQGSKDAPIALVGKGITFDSGGYNIKTSRSIAHMKSDMAGAATILGTIKAMAAQKAPVNLVAIMPMAENAISGDALLPGDVIKTAQGLTVEVLNTDAEGRLILADGLWYASTHYQPTIIIDVATLTGAKVRALGKTYAGVFSDADDLVHQLSDAGRQVGEKVWRLPLDQTYADELTSSIADLKNIGEPGSAGASSAAMFLQRFTSNQPWVHLDIAGNAMTAIDTPLAVTGATGYGVRLLSHWLNESIVTIKHHTDPVIRATQPVTMPASDTDHTPISPPSK